MRGSKGSLATLRAGTSAQEKADASPPRASEKKVRFSQELNQGAHAKQITGFQDSSESSPTFFVKASSQKEIWHKVPQQHLESATDEESHCQQQASESQCSKKDISAPRAPCRPPADKACASLLESSVQPVELTKSNENTGGATPHALVTALSTPAQSPAAQHCQTASYFSLLPSNSCFTLQPIYQSSSKSEWKCEHLDKSHFSVRP